jgi:Sec-independent protein translocase protein TatA
MFSGFWSWVFVLVLVVAIFSADRLPEFKKWLDSMAKDGVKLAKKGAQAAQEKIAEAKTLAEKAKKKKDKDDEDK